MASRSAGQKDADHDDAPCTIEELEAILTAPAGGFAMEPSSDYDQVFPNLYLGDRYDSNGCPLCNNNIVLCMFLV